jgi:hypothetical protein
MVRLPVGTRIGSDIVDSEPEHSPALDMEQARRDRLGGQWPLAPTLPRGFGRQWGNAETIGLAHLIPRRRLNRVLCSEASSTSAAHRKRRHHRPQTTPSELAACSWTISPAKSPGEQPKTAVAGTLRDPANNSRPDHRVTSRYPCTSLAPDHPRWPGSSPPTSPDSPGVPRTRLAARQCRSNLGACLCCARRDHGATYLRSVAPTQGIQPCRQSTLR